MLIRNTTMQELVKALDIVNEKFGSNIEFACCEHVGLTRQGGNKYLVRLTVKNSRGPGSRVSASQFQNRRRVKAACWHAHGTFFDALPEGVEIITSREVQPHKPGDPWKDTNIGSMMYPCMASEACDCGSTPRVRTKIVEQRKLSAECWNVQVWGLDRCKTCEYKGTPDCGGQEIIKTEKNQHGIQVPL